MPLQKSWDELPDRMGRGGLFSSTQPPASAHTGGRSSQARVSTTHLCQGAPLSSPGPGPTPLLPPSGARRAPKDLAAWGNQVRSSPRGQEGRWERATCISRDRSRKNEEGGAWDRAFPCPRGRPGSWAGKVRRRLGEGKAGRPALPLESPRLPAETFSRLREVRRGLPRRGAAGLGPSLSSQPGERRSCPLGALTVMAAPRGSGSRRQEGGKGSRAGLSGAGFPPPPPLSASRRRFSGPTLPRCSPGPFHPPIKLFFFFKLPGRTRAGQ